MIYKIILSAVFLSFMGFINTENSYAVPQSEVHVSLAKVPLDEPVTITVKMKWEASEGDYTLKRPAWKLANLTLTDTKKSSESYSIAGSKWLEKTYVFVLHADAKGPASIGNPAFEYVNTITNKTGRIRTPDQFSFTVKESVKAKYWLTIIGICILLLLTIGGSFALNYYTRYVAKKHARLDQIMNNQVYISAANNIRNYQDENIKNVYSRWSEEFKAFVILHYTLLKRDLTEAETIEAIKTRPDLPKEERSAVLNLFERLSQARYGNFPLKKIESEKLKNDVLEFIESKKVVDTIMRRDDI